MATARGLLPPGIRGHRLLTAGREFARNAQWAYISSLIGHSLVGLSDIGDDIDPGHIASGQHCAGRLGMQLAQTSQNLALAGCTCDALRA